MLFTLGSTRASTQKAINKAISRSLIFDDTVTFDQAKSDWLGSSVKCRALCGSYSNGKLTTGQTQGAKGNRHYVAVAGAITPNLPSVLANSATFDTSLLNLGLEVDWRYTTTATPGTTPLPKYGDGGHGCPGNPLLVFCSRSGQLMASMQGGGANSYYSASSSNPGGTYQTWTYTQCYSYSVYNIWSFGTNSGYAGNKQAPATSSGVQAVTSLNVGGSWLAFLRPAFSSATWGTYSTGVGFGNSTQTMTTSDTLTNRVPLSDYRDFPLSVSTNVADETVVPSWSAMITSIADRRVFLKFDVGTDIEQQNLVPGTSSELSVNTDSITYSVPDYIRC